MTALASGSTVIKTSIDCICSPISTSSSDQRTRLPVETSVERLPREVIARIAFHLVVDDRGIGRKPAALLALLRTSRTVNRAISFDNNPRLYHSLFKATFDYAALTRRYHWMLEHLSDVARRGGKGFDLFKDPKSWAIDYQTRWTQSRRMRQVAKLGKIDLPGVCDQDQITADLWNVWFLLTENDGKNIVFLAEECHFQAWIVVHCKENMLKDSLAPGYPKASGAKSLSLWCALLSGTDASAEQTPAEVDEKIFILRPYVFACAEYDITYAPWHYRRLPISGPECQDHRRDVTVRDTGMTYERFGYTWRRAPPHFILGCYLVFLRLLERQPGRTGLKPGSSTFSSPPSDAFRPGLFSTTRVMPSIYHDREWQRNAVCGDPHCSPGLRALAFRGEIKGFWRGKFLFNDWNMYRQILAGHLIGLYTGGFAEQAVEMEFQETVIKLRYDEVGGSGPLLCAGFNLEEGNGSEEEQTLIESGYGHEVCSDEEEPDEPGWTKEILISGRARTFWGLARVRGRVRSWDGLVILALAYPAHPLGRWLWRGYLHTGGHMIGRWRDTFSDEHSRGYEGAFGMIRAGDIFYPSHFPTRMEDSLGVDRDTASQPSGPPFPPKYAGDRPTSLSRLDPESPLNRTLGSNLRGAGMSAASAQQSSSENRECSSIVRTVRTMSEKGCDDVDREAQEHSQSKMATYRTDEERDVEITKREREVSTSPQSDASEDRAKRINLERSDTEPPDIREEFWHGRQGDDTQHGERTM